MKYTLKAGIAAFIEVNSASFPTEYGENNQDYVYISKEKPVENTNPYGIEFGVLPVPVQDVINEHFESVFSLPLGSRKGYLDQLVPIVVFV